MQGKKSSSGRKMRRRGSHKSEYSKYVAQLKKDFGGQWSSHGKNKYREMMIVWSITGKVPPRIPLVKNLPDADFTTVQMASTFNTSSSVSSMVISQSGSTAVYGVIAFRLDDLSQVSTFSSLFDQYRIERVLVRMTPRSNSVALSAQASPNQVFPQMWVVADYDDSTALTSISSAQEYPNCQQLTVGNAIDILIQPAITPAVYSGGAFSGYGVQPSSSMWIDVANTSVPHFGVKFAISALQVSSTYTFAWDVQAFYTVSFRNPR